MSPQYTKELDGTFDSSMSATFLKRPTAAVDPPNGRSPSPFTVKHTTDMFRTKAECTSTSLLGWPTDAFKIDVVDPSAVHTVLIFTPGNPGLVEWYIPFFEQILQELGPGFACRGVANAGHSLCHDKVDVAARDESLRKSKAIPWTVDGQSLHKCAFVDQVVHEFESKNSTRQPSKQIQFIFISHSIGCHFVQRMCVLRPDILRRAVRFFHLMPFIRMKAPKGKAMILDAAAAAPNAVIRAHEYLMNGLASLPLSAVDALLVNTMNDAKGRQVAAKLLQLPAMARNFYTLGCEEIRDVPEQFDVSDYCSTS